MGAEVGWAKREWRVKKSGGGGVRALDGEGRVWSVGGGGMEGGGGWQGSDGAGVGRVEGGSEGHKDGQWGGRREDLAAGQARRRRGEAAERVA